MCNLVIIMESDVRAQPWVSHLDAIRKRPAFGAFFDGVFTRRRFFRFPLI